MTMKLHRGYRRRRPLRRSSPFDVVPAGISASAILLVLVLALRIGEPIVVKSASGAISGEGVGTKVGVDTGQPLPERRVSRRPPRIESETPIELVRARQRREAAWSLYRAAWGKDGGAADLQKALDTLRQAQQELEAMPQSEEVTREMAKVAQRIVDVLKSLSLTS